MAPAAVLCVGFLISGGVLNRPLARLALEMFPLFLSWRALRFVKDLVVLKFLLLTAFSLGRIPSRNLLIGYVTACDPHIFDAQISANCGKGEFAMDMGLNPSGAMANIERERQRNRDTRQ